MKRFEIGEIYKLPHHVYDNNTYYFKVLKRNQKSIRIVEIEQNGTEIPGEEAITVKLYEDDNEYVMVPDIDVDGGKRRLSA